MKQKTPSRRPRALLLALSLAAGLAGPALASAAPTHPWAFWAPVELGEPGLYELALPIEALNVARPDLADLRLLDPEGMEVPYWVHRSSPKPPRRRAVHAFRAELRERATVLSLETGAESPLEAVRLEAAEPSFLKAATIEGSRDGATFVVLGRGVPLFRRSGSENLGFELAGERWTHLRITIDDEREAPVAWTGASVDEASGPDPFLEPVDAPVRARDERPGATRLSIDLGAANLTLAAVELVTADPLFQRRVSLRETRLVEEEIREHELQSGVVYAVEGAQGGAARRTQLRLEQRVSGRELVVEIENGDSPPLPVSAIQVWRRPVYLRFQAREPGLHRLYLGHARAGAPKYDLEGLGTSLREASATSVRLGAVQSNSEHQAPEPLPELSELAATIDTARWRYKKAVSLARPGVQALELDLDVTSRAAADLSDLRLVLSGHQVPYVIERPSVTRTLRPEVHLERHEKRPNLSLWRFELGHPRLPLAALECRPETTLFQRRVELYERVSDGRGGRYARQLGAATWERKGETRDRTVVLYLTETPVTNTVWLETDDGDNPPLSLTDCRFSHPVRRLVFKASQPPELHYGNPKAARPRYDLSLVAEELLAAERAEATLGPEIDRGDGARFSGEEVLKLEGWIFWGVLAAVMLGLLFVIAKLLPKP